MGLGLDAGVGCKIYPLISNLCYLTKIFGCESILSR